MKVFSVLFALIAVCIGLWPLLLAKAIWTSSRRRVLRRLEKTGSARVRHVWRFERVWSPAGRANVDDGVYGPGEALYTLDEAGTVHLEFHESDGRVRRFSGPIPAPVRRPEHKTSPQTRKLIRRTVAGFAAVMITGFTLGYTLGGPSLDRRMEGGSIGQLAAMSLALLAIAIFEIKHQATINSRRKRAT